jgi:hypothetical protein
MHGGTRDLETTRSRAHRVDGGPWAVALNETAATDEITVTLLALAVVDDVIRVSGIVRVVRRPDVRLSNVPTLTLATLDGPPLELLGAHALPNARMVWVSWTYERPADVRTEYEGRIDHIDLAYRAGRVVQEAAPGPWVFTFRVPDGIVLGGRCPRADSVGKA